MDARRLPTWREMHLDTSPAVEELQFKFYREAPVWKKWELVNQLNQTARTLALSGLRERHPQVTPEILQRLLADMVLGPELAERVYGPLLVLSQETIETE